jgi:S-methylmethionine-dependent homocysteine/selenocysteine methylase
MYQNVIIPYLYEAQHVSDDTLPIIRSLKLHWQPLVFCTWKVFGRLVGGCCQVHCAHHQEPKTALAASGFSYVEGCWTCS